MADASALPEHQAEELEALQSIFMDNEVELASADAKSGATLHVTLRIPHAGDGDGGDGGGADDADDDAADTLTFDVAWPPSYGLDDGSGDKPVVTITSELPPPDGPRKLDEGAPTTADGVSEAIAAAVEAQSEEAGDGPCTFGVIEYLREHARDLGLVALPPEKVDPEEESVSLWDKMQQKSASGSGEGGDDEGASGAGAGSGASTPAASSRKATAAAKLTKAQKRRALAHVGHDGEVIRGWNWVDVVSHLRKSGSAAGT